MKSLWSVSILSLWISPLWIEIAVAQDCAGIQDDKMRLACYDAAAKKSAARPKTPKIDPKSQETPLTPAGKSCVFSASQTLGRALPNLQVLASRVKPSAQKSGNSEMQVFDVEIDATAAGQKSTFMFLCGMGPAGTVTQPLGQR